MSIDESASYHSILESDIINIIQYFGIARPVNIFNEMGLKKGTQEYLNFYNYVKFLNKIIKGEFEDNIEIITNEDAPHIKMYIDKNAVKNINFEGELSYIDIFNRYVNIYGKLFNFTELIAKNNEILYGLEYDAYLGEKLGLILTEEGEYSEERTWARLKDLLDRRLSGLKKCFQQKKSSTTELEDNKHIKFFEAALKEESSLQNQPLEYRCRKIKWGYDDFIEAAEEVYGTSEIPEQYKENGIPQKGMYIVPIGKLIDKIKKIPTVPNDIISILNNLRHTIYISEKDYVKLMNYIDEIRDKNNELQKLLEEIILYRFRPGEMLNITFNKNYVQPVFGFSNSIKKYRHLPRYFQRLMKFRPTGEEPCDPLVEYSLLLNLMYTLCNVKMSDLIRFIFEKKKAFIYDRDYTEHLGEELYKMKPIGLMNIKFVDDRKGRLRKNYNNLLSYFIFYNVEEKDPLDLLIAKRSRIQLVDMYGRYFHIGTILYKRMITYREFIMLFCILKLHIYRNIFYPEIIFLSKRKLTNNEINEYGIIPIEFKCYKDTKDGKKYLLRYETDEKFINSLDTLRSHERTKYTTQFFKLGFYREISGQKRFVVSDRELSPKIMQDLGLTFYKHPKPIKYTKKIYGYPEIPSRFQKEFQKIIKMGEVTKYNVPFQLSNIPTHIEIKPKEKTYPTIRPIHLPKKIPGKLSGQVPRTQQFSKKLNGSIQGTQQISNKLRVSVPGIQQIYDKLYGSIPETQSIFDKLNDYVPETQIKQYGGQSSIPPVLQLKPELTYDLIKHFDPIIPVILYIYQDMRKKCKIQLECPDNFDDKIIIFNPYVHINTNQLSINKSTFTQTYGGRILKLNEFMKEGKYGILLYKPLSYKFLEYNEIIQRFDIQATNVLCVRNISFVEAQYYNHIRAKTTVINVIDSAPTDWEMKLKHIKQFFPISNVINYQSLKNFLEEPINQFYDLIVIEYVKYHVDVLGKPTNLIYEEFYNIRLKVALFFHALRMLVQNGHLIIYLQHVTTKPIADLVIFAKKVFREAYLYVPLCTHMQKYACVYLVCLGFRQQNPDDIADYTKLINQLIIIDPSFVKFNVTFKIEKEPNTCYQNILYTANKDYVEISSLLDIKESEPYEFIRQFNEDIYYQKYFFYRNILTYYQSDENGKQIILRNLRNNQLVDAYTYAAKYKLQTFEFDPKTFQNDFSTLILQNMYSYHKSIKFKFKKVYFKQIDRPLQMDKFIEEKKSIINTDRIIDTRNIDVWYQKKLEYRYYRPKNTLLHLTNEVKNKFDTGPISQAWLKMYEMMVAFKFKFGPVFRTFHICEAPGNFIAAINHYLMTETDVKEFDWNAQSLNPEVYHKENKSNTAPRTAFGDDYGLIKKYPDRWHYGADGTGDITKMENIKFYKPMIRKADLVTSDCGIPLEASEEASNSDKELFYIHYSAIMAILLGLSKGKSFIAKLFFPFDKILQISLLYLIYQSFGLIYIYKSVINLYSKEFYLVGRNYMGIDKDVRKRLKYIHKNFTVDTHISGDLYPEIFLLQLTYINSELCRQYKFNFKRQLYFVDNYQNIPKEYLDLQKRYIRDKNEEWITKNKLKRIDPRLRL